MLRLAEALAGAGCTCETFVKEAGPEPELAYPHLLLAAQCTPWSPAQHARWPPRFRAAARAFLVAARARGVASAECADGSGRVCLPRELCAVVLAAASLPVSGWV